MLAIALPPLTSLGGVVLGWRLTRGSALEAVADERVWQERREARRRQADAAARLDERVHAALRDIPSGDPRTVGDKLDLARNRLIRAWQRATVISDPEIERRMDALDMALLIGAQDGRAPGAESVNIWPITVALRELRTALACCQRGDQPPPAQFPIAAELIQLAHPGGRSVGLDGVGDLLMDRGAT